jgi:hypothetical protein
MSKKGSKSKKSVVVPLVFDSPSSPSSKSNESEFSEPEVSPSSSTTTTTTVTSATPSKLRPQVPSRTNFPARGDPSTENSELEKWEEVLLNLPNLDPNKSPALQDPSGMDKTEHKKWKRECEWWEKRVAHDKWVRESYQAALVREQSATSSVVRTTKERKVNKDLPIEKFTMELSKEKPFYIWYRTFEREMVRKDASAVEILNHLYFYVEKKCFANWSEAMSSVQMNDLQMVITQLDLHFPDKKTPIERRTAFRAYKQIQPDVLAYSNEKERLYRLAYPALDPGDSDDYRDSWLEGLYSPFVKTIWYESLQESNIRVLVRRVVELERAELASNSSYSKRFGKIGKLEVPKEVTPKIRTNSKKYSREVGTKSEKVERDSKGKPLCHQFLQSRKCEYGSECFYSHEEPKKPSDNSRKNYDSTGTGGTTRPGNLKQ